MAKVELNFVLKDLRKHVGNVVFSKWKATNYLKEYVYRPAGNSPEQVQARNNFSLLVELWKPLSASLRSNWHRGACGLNMTGFNRFIGVNARHLDRGEALELSHPDQGEPLSDFAVYSGKTQGTLEVSFTYPPTGAGRHLVLAVQKVDANRVTGPVRFIECGPNATSPQQLNLLEAGISYVVYGLLADNQLANAQSFSPTVSGNAVATA